MDHLPLEEKATIVPLHYWDPSDDCANPIRVTEDISVENSSQLLRAEHFGLWRDYISKKDRTALVPNRIALIHRFQSDPRQGEREKKSKDLMHRLFVCCRLVKPTRSRFTAIQVKWTTSKEIEVFSFTYPESPTANVPDAEVLNVITGADIQQVKNLSGNFLKLVEDGPFFLRRAIKCYEEGYAETTDPVLQFILWTMGIEAILRASGEGLTNPAEELLRQVSPDLDIYAAASPRDYKPWTPILLRDVAHDVFLLRNQFVHGSWVPEGMKLSRRESIAGQSLPYSEVLRDAASSILRHLIQENVRTIVI